MSLSHTFTLKHLRLIMVVFGALLFAAMIAASARTAHAASYVTSGTITLCHAGSGSTNTWNTLAVNATIPSGSFGVSFQVQSASDCSSTPGAFTGQTFTVANGNTTPQNISGAAAASKALFVQIKLTGDGTNTPVLNSATLVDTPSVTDTTAPTVTISPLSGTQSGIITVSATATDNTGGSGVAKVDFYESTSTCSASSTRIGTDTTGSGSTYSVSWDTSALNGTFNVCAVATDGSSNASAPSSTSVTVSNQTQDTTPPTSTLSGPGTASVSGSVTLSATATDNSGGSGVKQVAFYESASGTTCGTGSTPIGAPVTAPTSGTTYTTSWDTTKVANATYNVCSVATDNSSNVQRTPSTQSFTVNNVATTAATTWITPVDGANVTPSASTTLKVNTANYSPAVQKVTFKDGSNTVGTATSGTSATNGGRDWSVTWNTSSLTGSHSLSATVTNTSGVAQTPATITVNFGGGSVDTQPPTAPSNLTASSVTATSVHLSWTASTDNVGVTGYHIYRNGSATALATTTSTTFDDTSLSPTSTYTYIVKAFDAANNLSNASNQVSVSTPCAGDCVAPTAPTNLTGSASLVGTTAVRVSLSWGAASDNVGVASYVVLRGGTSGLGTAVVVATGVTGTSYVDNSVSPNTGYTYGVEAKDAAGNVSPVSNVFSVTTPRLPDTQAPSVPQNVSASLVGSNQVNVTWSASTDNVGVDHYIVLRNGSQLGTSSTTSFGDGTVAPANTYAYSVEAADASGNVSASSTTASVTIPATGSIPVYRLRGQFHLFTTSTQERDIAISFYGYISEGPGGIGFNALASGGSPVYRLVGIDGRHFWTTSTVERDADVASYGYFYEGVGFNEDTTQQQGDTPIYRLISPAGDHFYTADAQERDIDVSYYGYVYEGIAWYAPTQ